MGGDGRPFRWRFMAAAHPGVPSPLSRDLKRFLGITSNDPLTGRRFFALRRARQYHAEHHSTIMRATGQGRPVARFGSWSPQGRVLLGDPR